MHFSEIDKTCILKNNGTKDMSKKVACLDWLAVPDPLPDNLQVAPPAPDPRCSRLSFSYCKKAHMQNTQGIHINKHIIIQASITPTAQHNCYESTILFNILDLNP